MEMTEKTCEAVERRASIAESLNKTIEMLEVIGNNLERLSDFLTGKGVRVKEEEGKQPKCMREAAETVMRESQKRMCELGVLMEVIGV